MSKWTTYHLCVSCERALEELKKGNNLFYPSPPNQVLRELTEQMAKGKKYYTGCDNEDKDGRCAGHK